MRGIRLAVLLLLLIAPSAWGQVTLPQQTGAINDYAAQLGIETRDRLEFLIARLQSGADINANLIITLIDPFSNPSNFSAALWSEWALPEERAILVAFIREENIWRFHWRSSNDLKSALNELENAEYFDRVRNLVSDRRVVHAAIEFFEVLSENFVGPEIEEVIEEPLTLEQALEVDAEERNLEDEFISSLTTESINQVEAPGFFESNATLLYVIGGIAASIILLLLIKLAFSLTCPECGGRLQKRENSMRALYNQRVTPRHTQRISYCTKCNYQHAK